MGHDVTLPKLNEIAARLTYWGEVRELFSFANMTVGLYLKGPDGKKLPLGGVHGAIGVLHAEGRRILWTSIHCYLSDMVNEILEKIDDIFSVMENRKDANSKRNVFSVSTEVSYYSDDLNELIKVLTEDQSHGS